MDCIECKREYVLKQSCCATYVLPRYYLGTTFIPFRYLPDSNRDWHALGALVTNHSFLNKNKYMMDSKACHEAAEFWSMLQMVLNQSYHPSCAWCHDSNSGILIQSLLTWPLDLLKMFWFVFLPSIKDYDRDRPKVKIWSTNTIWSTKGRTSLLMRNKIINYKNEPGGAHKKCNTQDNFFPLQISATVGWLVAGWWQTEN